MSDEVLETLARFQREVARGFASLRDEFRTEIGSIRANVASFRDESLSHFDSIYKRFDHLETEYEAIKAGVKRLEERDDTGGVSPH